MTKLTLLTAFLFIISFFSNAQESVEVTDQTLKIAALTEEDLYFGFAEGDKIIFNFQEVNNKELKELEIIEYPNNSKYSDYKTSKIENKNLNVTKKGVYVFRFKNSAISGRICKIKIHRIPANNDTKNFNSTVTWINKQDTTWNTFTKDVIIGYDTTYQQKTKKVVIKTEQKEEEIFNKVQRVHSSTNEHGNKTHLFFSLPANQNTPYQTKKVIAWAYWIGVDEAGAKAWEQNAKTVGGLAKGVAGIYLTPIGALAVGAVADLMLPTIGEDVQYYIVGDEANKNLFYAGQQFSIFDKGKGVAGYNKFTAANLCQGTFYILLSNDNIVQGINATVRAIAIIETTTYEDKQYIEKTAVPKIEKQIFKEPVITSKKVPMTN